MKIKLFQAQTRDELETQLNSYISTHPKIIDIKYSTDAYIRYNAMVIYNE